MTNKPPPRLSPPWLPTSLPACPPLPPKSSAEVQDVVKAACEAAGVVDPTTRGAFFWPPSEPQTGNAPAKHEFGERMTRERMIRLNAEKGVRTLEVRNMSEVVAEAVDWLWEGFIPVGYLTIWAGESGAGKSTVLADIAARVTTGSQWPGASQSVPRPPKRVLWLSSEDSTEEMIVPRLKAAGANLSLVQEVRGVKTARGRETFSIQDDLGQLAALLRKHRANGTPVGLLVLDPITSYLNGSRLRKVDLNDAGQLRSILEPTLVLAQAEAVAVVCVTHFGKDETRKMVHRVLGSTAFVQTSRSLVTITAAPDGGQFDKVLIQAKGNLPSNVEGAWRFHTEKLTVEYDSRNRKPIEATRVVWDGVDTAVTADRLIGSSQGPVSQYATTFGLWLSTHFRFQQPSDGWLPVTTVKQTAIDEGRASRKWWDDHSGEFLEKENRSGTWMCRPKRGVPPPAKE